MQISRGKQDIENRQGPQTLDVRTRAAFFSMVNEYVEDEYVENICSELCLPGGAAKKKLKRGRTLKFNLISLKRHEAGVFE